MIPNLFIQSYYLKEEVDVLPTFLVFLVILLAKHKITLIHECIIKGAIWEKKACHQLQV